MFEKVKAALANRPGQDLEAQEGQNSWEYSTLSSLEDLTLCGILAEHLIKVRLENGIVFASSDSLILHSI